MCSSPVSPLVDLTPAMIQIPSTPTNCAEVVGFHLLAALRQPQTECDPVLVSNLWYMYSLLRNSADPPRHARFFSKIIKDLPHEVKEDLAREVSGLTDGGSVLLARLLASEQSPLGRAVPTGSHLHLAFD